MAKTSSQFAKFGRPRSQRQALLKTLADSLILEESIETTLPKAKAVVRYTEKLVVNARKGKSSVAHRRRIISSLSNIEAAHKLVDDIAPKLASRQSGYFRIEKLRSRRGDNALMAKVSFVDELKGKGKASKKPVSATKQDENLSDKPQSNEQSSQPQSPKDSDTKIQPKAAARAPKRSGVRGNR